MAILHITDEMTDAGRWILERTQGDPDLTDDARVAAIFMAMMVQYDPSVTFSAGGDTEFKFRTRPQSI